MKKTDRRDFLKTSAKGLAAATLVNISRSSRAASANDKIVVGVIGTGGRGTFLSKRFAIRDSVDIKYLCDADGERGVDLLDQIDSEQKNPVHKVSDYRRVLDDKEVDAVIVATPDHWHGPGTVFACQAGKDVYVEKPASHNLWEGRKMVEAARKYKCVVQVGTQTRSGDYCRKAIEYIQSGKLGTIHLCKVYNLKSGSAYHNQPDGKKPENVDFDRWLGPAPLRPYNRHTMRSGWYNMWDFCGGDFGNDGSHQFDLARWIVGKTVPTEAHCTGGNFAFDDDRETPDTQVASFKFDDMVMTFDMTQYAPYMSKTPLSLRDTDEFPHWPQNATRIELYGTKELMIIGRHGGGWQTFKIGGKVVAEQPGRFPNEEHIDNFLNCIRTRKRPNADIEEGHHSACLIHLGNISYRLGGRKLQFDPKTETVVNDSEANRLLKRVYREPYVIPENV